MWYGQVVKYEAGVEVRHKDYDQWDIELRYIM